MAPELQQLLIEQAQVPLSADLFVKHQPDPEAGPVAVEIGYRIAPESAAEFLDAVAALLADGRVVRLAGESLAIEDWAPPTRPNPGLPMR